MDDNLEKFIKSHRAEMDDKNLRRDLWAGIENELKPPTTQRHISKSVVFWRSAAVILLLITSWLAFEKVYQNDADSNEMELAEINPQLLEAETFYISLIDQKRKEMEMMSAKYDFSNDFLYEIDVLDSMYVVLKHDMKNGNTENLADAIILNLQLRIEVLNQQLRIIESIENIQKDEKIIL